MFSTEILDHPHPVDVRQQPGISQAGALDELWRGDKKNVIHGIRRIDSPHLTQGKETPGKADQKQRRCQDCGSTAHFRSLRAKIIDAPQMVAAAYNVA